MPGSEWRFLVIFPPRCWSAGLDGLFEDHLSTDRVRAFKPDPRTYRMGIESFKLKREEIVFAAFVGVVPDSIGTSTAELAAFVQTL